MRMSRIESAIRLVLEFHKALNRRDLPGMMQFISEDCLFEAAVPAPNGSAYTGKEAITRFWQSFFDERTKVHMEIEEIFGLGERCVMRWRSEWINKTGERNHLRGVDVFRVREDTIREQYSYVKGAWE